MTECGVIVTVCCSLVVLAYLDCHAVMTIRVLRPSRADGDRTGERTLMAFAGLDIALAAAVFAGHALAHRWGWL